MNELVGPPNIKLTAGTEVPDNSSYLVKTSSTPTIQDPLSGSTMGILMILSTFQYQSPVANPIYSTAISQASHAAFVQCGGQSLQDQISLKATNTAKNLIHSLGVTDGEVGTVLGVAKVIRDKAISLDGPRIASVKTHFSASQTNGSIGLGWDFK